MMKKINIKFYVALLCMFGVVSCTIDEEGVNVNERAVSLTARIQSEAGTRTAIENDGTVTWMSSDNIGVFGDKNSKNVPFKLLTGEGTTASFSGTLAEEEIPVLAYYPYTEEASFDGTALKMTFPKEYEYTGNTYGPMLGKRNDDGSFTFRHLASMLKLTINVPEKASMLLIESDYWAPDISGSFVVPDIAVDEAIMEENNAFSSHDLLVHIPSSMRGGLQTFYIPLPASTYSELIVYLKDENNETIWRKPMSKVTFKRGIILGMPEISSTQPMVMITSHTNGEIIEGYGAIQKITLKGYVDNFSSFNGKITLKTEESRNFVYDGYWNPSGLPSGKLNGMRHYFETEVELHRGKNTYTIDMSGEDSGNNEYSGAFDFILNYKENDEPAEAVDLGLSVKWASHNLGASQPEELGWGYTWADNTGTDVGYEDQDDYNGLVTQIQENQEPIDISGEPSWDPVAYKWKGGWRMPTLTEVKELVSNTTCQEERDGSGILQGYRLTGKNGNSIFFPVNGVMENAAQMWGMYWTGNSFADISGVSIQKSCSFIYWYDIVEGDEGQRRRVDCVYHTNSPASSFWHNRCYIRPVYAN